MSQIPRGPDHLYCPAWRKKMSRVCHTCPLWAKLRGMNRNTGQEIDDWQCTLSMLPMLVIENTQMARESGAAVESFRNESVKASERANHALHNVGAHIARTMAQAVERLEQRTIASQPPQMLIEEKRDGADEDR